jgi:hypothetical protein
LIYQLTGIDPIYIIGKHRVLALNACRHRTHKFYQKPLIGFWFYDIGSTYDVGRTYELYDVCTM